VWCLAPLAVRAYAVAACAFLLRLRLGLAGVGSSTGGDRLGRLGRGGLNGGLLDMRRILVRTLVVQRLSDDLRAVAGLAGLPVLRLWFV
jgi:hypothetical protein